MDDTSAGASAQAEAPAAGPSWHGLMTPASTGGPNHTGAAPSAEMDLNDDSMPVLDEAPVSRRTRLSLALASVLPAASGTTQGTVEGPATWLATARRVMWADEHEWDDEYYATTDGEFDDSHYVLFDDDDGDCIIGDDDDTSQHAGESSDEYEARLNGIIHGACHRAVRRHTCCSPVSGHLTIDTSNTSARAAPGVHVGQPAPKAASKVSHDARRSSEECVGSHASHRPNYESS